MFVQINPSVWVFRMGFRIFTTKITDYAENANLNPECYVSLICIINVVVVVYRL
jgi:hypothetical protein